MDINALRNLSYGVYIISTMDGEHPTGCIANSVMQVTHNIIAASLNHRNFTNECVKKTKKFAVSVLDEHSNPAIIGTFGFHTGRDTDKFKDVKFTYIDGMPVIEDACAYLICNVKETVETDTHTIFLGELTDCNNLNPEPPMTYAYYHNVIKGSSPETAPTYINPQTEVKTGVRYQCKICKYIYEGDITKEPDTYVCPICRQPKSVFERIN